MRRSGAEESRAERIHRLYDEHRALKIVVEDISRTPPASRKWKGKFKVLADMLSVHFDDEETLFGRKDAVPAIVPAGPPGPAPRRVRRRSSRTGTDAE